MPTERPVVGQYVGVQEASITTADIRKFGEDVNKLLSG
jgi:hypothetical protein